MATEFSQQNFGRSEWDWSEAVPSEEEVQNRLGYLHHDIRRIFPEQPETPSDEGIPPYVEAPALTGSDLVGEEYVPIADNLGITADSTVKFGYASPFTHEDHDGTRYENPAHATVEIARPMGSEGAKDIDWYVVELNKETGQYDGHHTSYVETADGAREHHESDDAKPLVDITAGDLALRKAIGGRDEDPLLDALRDMFGDDGSFLPEDLTLPPEDDRPDHNQLSDVLHPLLDSETASERGSDLSALELYQLTKLAKLAQKLAQGKD